MTRQERLEERERRIRERQDKDKRELALVQSARRDDARKARDRRRYQVGRLADEAGLLAWEDGTLTSLFALLGTLQSVPNPAAVLEGLLGEVDGHALADAVAPPIPKRDGVSTAC